MKVLVALTYYRPHLSGLTIYVERLATALAARGHEVTVLASHHDPSCPRDATEDGVRVVRVPVAFRAGKGVVMPTHGRLATKLLREHEVLSLHVPQFEAWSLAARARLLQRPTVMTYHCDLRLPAGALNRVVDRVIATSNGVAGRLADRIVAYTDDYARSVPLLRQHRSKVEVVPPPVVMPSPQPGAVEEFRRTRAPAPDAADAPLIGMAARFATEKGIDVLLDALPLLEQHYPGVRVLFAGPHEDIPGEQGYRARLEPAISRLGDRWRFLGSLDPVREMPAFLGSLDCLVVPSVNSTESFGLVQVEAMLCGTPVVASGLPGVREVVRSTGMGEVVRPGDAGALAGAIARVLGDPERYRRSRDDIEGIYALERTVTRYQELFRSVVSARRAGRGTAPSRA